MQFIEVQIHIFLYFYAAGATAEIYNESLLPLTEGEDNF